VDETATLGGLYRRQFVIFITWVEVIFFTFEGLPRCHYSA
jgi:hypothetical protein